MVFNLLPTSFEVLLVAGLLTYNCGWEYGAVSMLTMFVYSMFTFSVTQWRTRWVVRKRRIYDNCSKSRLCHYIRWLLYSSGHYIQVVTQMMYRCPLSTGGYCVKVTAIHMWLLPLWLHFLLQIQSRDEQSSPLIITRSPAVNVPACIAFTAINIVPVIANVKIADCPNPRSDREVAVFRLARSDSWRDRS